MATFQLYSPDRMYSVFAFSTPVMVSERPDSLQLQPVPDFSSGRPSAPILIVTTEFVVSSFVPAAVVSAAAADVPASANADTGRMESTILSASIMLTMRFFMISSPLLIDLPGCPPKQNNRNGQKAKLSITLKFMEIKHFRPPHLPKFGTQIWAKSPYGGGVYCKCVIKTPSVKACGFASSLENYPFRLLPLVAQRPRPLSQSLSALTALPKGEPLAVHANFISLPRPLPLGEVDANVVSRRRGRGCFPQ